MIEKILAPSDASETSELVLPYLEELGERLGSSITLLHVYPPRMSSFSENLQEYMEGLAQRLRESMESKGKVEYLILNGRPSEEIIYHAQEEKFDVIVMATHGESGVKHWVLGSTVDKVIRGTSKPVLLVRARSPRAVRKEGILSKVVVPLDGSRMAEVSLPYVEEIMLGLDARERQEVSLIEVISPTYRAASGKGFLRGSYTEVEIERLKGKTAAYLEGVVERLRSKDIPARYEVLVGDEAQKIMEFSDGSDANLLAMATHGISGFNRQFLGKVADRILHHGKTTLMLIKPE